MRENPLMRVVSCCLWLLCSSFATGQECNEIQLEDLGNTAIPSPTGLLADTLNALPGASPAMIQVLQLNEVCLGQGSMKGTYRSVSVIVEYFDMTASNNLTVQTEYQCENGLWVIMGTPEVTTNPTGTLTTPPRTDCARCIGPLSAPVILPITPDEHCAGKPTECS